MQLHELTATAAVGAMRRGALSPVGYIQALLDRIAATEPRVQAWETLDAEGALAAARSLEARRGERLPRELLFGLPVGIKDVFDARGLPTTANFAPFRDRVAYDDAGVVQRLRAAGAIILGKTVTTQFAYATEGIKTRNPWNPTRTPGGSSSGSAAAVGAYQVPAAIGTQTGGSTLRPAAWCGAVALKPTLGRVSRTVCRSSAAPSASDRSCASRRGARASSARCPCPCNAQVRQLPSSFLLVALGQVALLDLLDHGRIGQRRRVAEHATLGHIAQQAAHDLR